MVDLGGIPGMPMTSGPVGRAGGAPDTAGGATSADALGFGGLFDAVAESTAEESPDVEQGSAIVDPAPLAFLLAQDLASTPLGKSGVAGPVRARMFRLEADGPAMTPVEKDSTTEVDSAADVLAVSNCASWLAPALSLADGGGEVSPVRAAAEPADLLPQSPATPVQVAAPVPDGPTPAPTVAEPGVAQVAHGPVGEESPPHLPSRHAEGGTAARVVRAPEPAPADEAQPAVDAQPNQAARTELATVPMPERSPRATSPDRSPMLSGEVSGRVTTSTDTAPPVQAQIEVPFLGTGSATVPQRAPRMTGPDMGRPTGQPREERIGAATELREPVAWAPAPGTASRDASDQGTEDSSGHQGREANGAGQPGQTVVPIPALSTSSASPLLASSAGNPEAPRASSSLSAETGEQVSSQVVQSLRTQLRGGIGEAVVRLRPEFLGEVTITIRVERGAVEASVKAELPAVREWLEAQEATVRQNLSEQGLSLTRLRVEPDGERQPGQGGEEPHPQGRQPRQPRKDEQRFDLLV